MLPCIKISAQMFIFAQDMRKAFDKTWKDYETKWYVIVS